VVPDLPLLQSLPRLTAGTAFAVVPLFTSFTMFPFTMFPIDPHLPNSDCVMMTLQSYRMSSFSLAVYRQAARPVATTSPATPIRPPSKRYTTVA